MEGRFENNEKETEFCLKVLTNNKKIWKYQNQTQFSPDEPRKNELEEIVKKIQEANEPIKAPELPRMKLRKLRKKKFKGRKN